MNIEHDLEMALRKVEPPDGFADRVMRRIESEQRSGRAPVRPVRRGWRAMAAGLLITAVAGGWAAQRAIERREGERARNEVMVALRIASSKVRTAQQHVREIGVQK